MMGHELRVIWEMSDYVKARRDLSQRQKKLAEFKAPKAPLELYRRFLFYKFLSTAH